MRLLLVHQNYPGQFKHLVPALRSQGVEVTVLSMRTDGNDRSVREIRTSPVHSTSATHPWARDFETKVIRAEATLRTALDLKAQGYRPDVIIAHPGWGDSLFLKEVWPESPLGLYCEFFYRAVGGDYDFDPEFAPEESAISRACFLKLRNIPQRLNIEVANAGISPTQFQARSYPAHFVPRIDVIHDGIDTEALSPRAGATLRLGNGKQLSRDDEVITYFGRNLEPYRGYHIFMRALPELLRRRPNAHVVIVGGHGASYGAAPAEGNWRDIFLAEVAEKIDRSRVHFVGMVAHDLLIGLMRISRLHVYLTYPFVLSWSFLEAMSVGATVLASDTAPIREVVQHGHNGRLFPFFEPTALANEACMLLEDEEQRRFLSANARATVQETYDLRSVCLPKQIDWVTRLAAATPIVPIAD